MHLLRPGARQRKAQAAAPVAASYPPGYFTEPVRRWWPGWVSSMEVTSTARVAAAQLAEIWSRADNGTGWGGGTTLMPGTPKNDAPGWLR